MLQLEYSRSYYEAVVVPHLRARLPEALDTCSFVDFFGDSGSFGWDDDLSREDSWGPRVMVVVPDDRMATLGEEIRRIALELPAYLPGHDAPPSEASVVEQARMPSIVVRSLSEHFVYGDPPAEAIDWLRIDENRVFAMITGAILNDPTGAFISRLARWRRSYYPEDVWLHRLAGALRTTASLIQSSDRFFARQDPVAMACSLGAALHDAMQVVFLLNREWAPYYKWRHRAFAALPQLAGDLHDPFERAATASRGIERVGALWIINDRLRRVLAERGLVDSPNEQLPVMADQVDARVSDPAIRAAAPWDTVAQQRWWEWTTP